MSDQSREAQERRDQALAYAVESTKGADPDTILTAAEKFLSFLNNSVTEDVVTEDIVTEDIVTESGDPNDSVTQDEKPTAKLYEKTF